MTEIVRISVPVSPEAAATLADEGKLQEAGQIVSALVLCTPSAGQDAAANGFSHVLLETKAAAAVSGLTDAEVDTELTAWKRERVSHR